jgi:hypothetical protein
VLQRSARIGSRLFNLKAYVLALISVQRYIACTNKNTFLQAMVGVLRTELIHESQN